MAKKILILDDEPEYLKTLDGILSQLGYKIITSESPTESLEIIHKEKPDLVLFDYVMADMDGEEFLSKAKGDNPDTLFILVTAWNNRDFLNRFSKLGVVDVIVKPMSLENLLIKMKKFLKE